MPEFKVWATSEDGSIEYVSITKDILEPALKAMHLSFYTNENICVAYNVPNQPESFPDMDKLLLNAAKDGVSIVARERATGKIAGAAFNQLQINNATSDFYENLINSSKYTASRDVAQWMSDIETMFNVFDHCKVTSVMEIMFLGILSEFRKRGIAKKLCQISIDIAKRLKHGENIKTPIDDKPLEHGNSPQGVTAICTSFVTQKIFRDLGFQVAAEISFDKFNCNGKSLGNIITDTPFITYEYIKI